MYKRQVSDPLVMLSAVEYGRCEALDPWKNIFSRLYMAAAGDCSLLIAKTADVNDRRSGVIVKKGLTASYSATKTNPLVSLSVKETDGEVKNMVYFRVNWCMQQIKLPVNRTV